MEIRKLLESVAAGFGRTRGEDEASGARDIAVADVALMIAALDGTVMPEEFAVYRRIAARCRGLAEAVRQVRQDAALRRAGYLLLMAQVGAASDDELLATFGTCVREVLPRGFAGFTRTDMRRAFVLWVSAATADGEVSRIERRAIGFLKRTYASADVLGDAFLETAERLLRDLGDPDRRSEAEAALDRLTVFSD